MKRIIQTFWSGGRDPLVCGYGWNHAEHNLMSWALSCCSLRAHYGRVELYTDQRGYDVLINKLRLPYSEVHVVYDDHLCLPQHWAYAKMKTYAMQTEPFLHVDGDIYLPKAIPQDVLSAPLVAQNREIGTVYYRRMMDNVLRSGGIELPEYITDALREQSVASYNMGMFGGHDLEFIHRCCAESFSFLERNRMNDPSVPHSRVGCNILFEQVFFAVLADLEHKEVSSVLGRAVKDEGYSGREFCDLAFWHHRPFFHLLGGHKRNPYNVEMFRRTLLRLYPDVLERIIPLFASSHRRFSPEVASPHAGMSIERSIARYEDVVERQQSAWESLSCDELLSWERRVADSLVALHAGDGARDGLMLERNPHLSLCHIPQEFHPEAVRLLHGRLCVEERYPLTDVAMVPCAYGNGMCEVPVVDMQMNALRMLHEHPMTYGELESSLLACYTLESEESKRCWRGIVERQVTELISKGVLAARNKHK